MKFLSNSVLLYLVFTKSIECASPFVSACDSSSLQQFWSLSSNKLQSLYSSSCLATIDCNPSAGGDVSLSDCASSQCKGVNNTDWQLDSQGRLVSGANSNLCLTLANVDGPNTNLWQCKGAVSNGQWDFTPSSAHPGYGTLQTRDENANRGCLTNPDGGSALIVLNTSRIGLPVYGIGGLAAIGGARLIYEYVEPQRTQILDLLFNSSGGTAFQILKTEIEGDIDSSYGSGPSFRHSRGEPASFNRGIYLPWLLGEAKKRQSNIGTYSLSWGLPRWVGNQSYLSDESLQYHIDYLVGVRETYGYVFDITGIHNERPFSRQWTIALRKALDLNGFHSTKISVNDDSNCCCTDCQNFTDSTITTAALNDPEFRQALGVIGLHSSSPLPSTYDWRADGKIFIQSEANDVDGPLIETADGSFPQWAPNAASPLGPGLEWPLHFLQNYAQGHNTGMIICPLSHAWTWLYGRHNHGTALFMRPWDGHFVLGAAFWTQAQITQAIFPGWFFLEGSAQGTSEQATYASFVSPSFDEFSIVAVNTDSSTTTTLNFQLTGKLSTLFSGTSIAVWISNSTNLFFQIDDILVSSTGNFSYSITPRSVLTITSLRSLRHADIPVPPRKPFSLPYQNSFSQQRFEEPGYLLSDLFGAFYVVNDPLGKKGQCLKQAVPSSPGANAWLGQDGLPFTSLPAPGTTFANGLLSASILLTSADLPAGGPSSAAASICGRVPVWQPADYASQEAHLGVCLWLWANGTWAVVDAELEKAQDLTLASGTLSRGSVLDSWHSLSLSFINEQVTASIDEIIVAANISGMRRSSGGYGLGTLWHVAYFDDIFFNTTLPYLGGSSFLFDILPGEAIVNNVTGWGGFELDLTGPSSTSFSVSALGRFKVRGNSASHTLDLIDASSLKSILSGALPTVDFSSCITDATGFCYGALSSPATLTAGKKYFFVSSETKGSDAFLSMYDAAAATTHAHRDGTTMMSYSGPRFGVVTGKVFGQDYSSLQSDGSIETMNGPINFLFA